MAKVPGLEAGDKLVFAFSKHKPIGKAGQCEKENLDLVNVKAVGLDERCNYCGEESDPTGLILINDFLATDVGGG